MNMETIFSLSSVLTMPFWLLMIALPHWRWSRRILSSLWIIAPAAVLYAVLILPQLGSVFGDLLNPSLGAISALLATPTGATAGWVHFLAFDLFVGRWIYLDNLKRQDDPQGGLSAWILSPILFLTLMVGPLGFLLYLIAQLFKPKG